MSRIVVEWVSEFLTLTDVYPYGRSSQWIGRDWQSNNTHPGCPVATFKEENVKLKIKPDKSMTHFEILNDAAIREISRRDRERRERRHDRRVRMQNFAARYGWKFWNRVFNLFKY